MELQRGLCVETAHIEIKRYQAARSVGVRTALLGPGARRHDAAPVALGVHKPRPPQSSPLFRLVSEHLHRLQKAYVDRFAREHCPCCPEGPLITTPPPYGVFWRRCQSHRSVRSDTVVIAPPPPQGPLRPRPLRRTNGADGTPAPFVRCLRGRRWRSILKKSKVMSSHFSC